MQRQERIILGIDPGTLVMGYGILRIRNRQLQVLEMNVLKLSSRKDPYERLHQIHQRVCSLIEEHQPTEFAIEAPFFGKNVQSMLKLGRAQGVAIAAAMQSGIPVHEYSPKKVKQSITGNGNAGKEQVWGMLQRILQVQSAPSTFDATDALAVALCHYYQDNPLLPALGKASSWEDFIRQNPDRIG